MSVEEPLVSFELREKYLLVIGHGKRDNFKDMVVVSEMVYAKALETKCHFLLLDYRSLYINLNMNEAVNIVKRSEAVQPEYKSLTAATVLGPPGVEFGQFWRHLAIQRGFNVAVFEDFDKAENWLMEQIRKVK
jgi:hypothetical protein